MAAGSRTTTDAVAVTPPLPTVTTWGPALCPAVKTTSVPLGAESVPPVALHESDAAIGLPCWSSGLAVNVIEC